MRRKTAVPEPFFVKKFHQREGLWAYGQRHSSELGFHGETSPLSYGKCLNCDNKVHLVQCCKARDFLVFVLPNRPFPRNVQKMRSPKLKLKKRQAHECRLRCRCQNLYTLWLFFAHPSLALDLERRHIVRVTARCWCVFLHSPCSPVRAQHA